ncbi:AprI/Inh family metalloprotease inhibitor [Pseudovibrio sp. Tun.PSC04-5.I4]|uniref:AprI/Inh family metalloprotease inhibitor n=1 Tax=Pseudovibrio sp. Tun.PSC04-5.I4 TaxID=1798213 RepID=UPI0008859B5B|nr:AprI/Inh family metalloprotease inhibitor [Pseudovibrio sp. Tun.PSC04-5.I4]SDR37682.1 Protease inhibitor Inh [Pseudovibrio sp. Tun.PSC04-5.I4]
MQLKRVALILCLGMAGCAQLIDSSLNDLADTPLRETNQKSSVSRRQPTEEHLTGLLELAGKWSVVRSDAQKPCALQLKTAQFGANFAASSVCSGNPNIWSWNRTEQTLELFDHRGDNIASLTKSSAGGWVGTRNDTGALIGLVQ